MLTRAKKADTDFFSKKVDNEFVSKKVEAEGLAEFETDAELDNNTTHGVVADIIGSVTVTCVSPEDREVFVSIQYREPTLLTTCGLLLQTSFPLNSHTLVCC